MKRVMFPLIFSLMYCVISAQTSMDTIELHVKNISLDMLKIPTNPAFLIMSISPTEIAEPGSAPEFYTSVQNASNNLSALPNSYAFSVTPFWWTKKAKQLSFTDDFDTKNSFTFLRTTSISGGMVQIANSDEKLWRYGIGFQSTLLMGKIESSKRNTYLNTLQEYHEAYYFDINLYYKKFQEYNLLEVERYDISLKIERVDSQLRAGDIDSVSADKVRNELIKLLGNNLEKQDSLKTVLGEKFDEENNYVESNKVLDKIFNEMNNRTGFKWDIGGGLSMNSYNNKIDSTGLYRAGMWSNFGGNIFVSKESSSNLSAFLLVRYLYYDKVNYMKEDDVELIQNLNTLDFGFKVQLEIIKKITLSVETIYRTGMSSSLYENTYKINGLAQYQMANNRLIYVSFGNDFNDQSNTGPEDLIVTFGVNIGFGGNVDIYDFKF